MNDILADFKAQLRKGRIQQAYRHIFTMFADLAGELKSARQGAVSVNSLYHGYLDMTYLPVTTDVLKDHGFKIAVVFDYASFGFELWLSAVNRKKRMDMLAVLADAAISGYTPVGRDANTDAIIEHKPAGLDDLGNRKQVVSRLGKETLRFIDDMEKFVAGKR
jgi:hypothetical protein